MMTQKINIPQKQPEIRLQTLKTKTTYRLDQHPKRNTSVSSGTETPLVTVERKRSIYAHRSRIDIIAHILDTSEHGAKKTHIMYQCNLSYRQLTGYLRLLDDMQLLTKHPKNPNTYQTTQKGKNFTKAYQNMKAILTTPV